MARMRSAGLEPDVAACERGPLGPLMRERARRGIIDPAIEEEDVLVLRGRRPRVSAEPAEPAAARSGTGS
jgi:release factor glutamine methyltransferase